MKTAAKFDQVFVKLSGMITEADLENWRTEDISPFVEFVVNTFGAHRCMFGSDWPVCLLATDSYQNVLHCLQQSLPKTLTQEERDAVFSGNAKRFYRI